MIGKKGNYVKSLTKSKFDTRGKHYRGKKWRKNNQMWSFKNIVEYLLMESQGSVANTDWNQENFLYFQLSEVSRK